MDVEEIVVGLNTEKYGDLFQQICQAWVLNISLIFFAYLITEIPEIKNKRTMLTFQKSINIRFKLTHTILSILPSFFDKLNNRNL